MCIRDRGKVIVALCAVHSVIDSDEADTFLWENHFTIIDLSIIHILRFPLSAVSGIDFRQHLLLVWQE